MYDKIAPGDIVYIKDILFSEYENESRWPLIKDRCDSFRQFSVSTMPYVKRGELVLVLNVTKVHDVRDVQMLCCHGIGWTYERCVTKAC
jgi:hypothetical protein